MPIPTPTHPLPASHDITPLSTQASKLAGKRSYQRAGYLEGPPVTEATNPPATNPTYKLHPIVTTPPFRYLDPAGTIVASQSNHFLAAGVSDPHVKPGNLKNDNR
ncbi:hypothetical protein XENTR_v10015725 [Xenopus tropicalis]|nr:hypothetical protein XENTR_v10015725 [Xenopus tropicalis]